VSDADVNRTPWQTAPVQLLTVKATITMSGISAGSTVQVDPSDAHIALCLRQRYLIPA
jgi:hypothetical protein